MTKLRINHQILLLIILAFVSGCNDIGTAKFDEVASGTGSSQDGNNPSPTPTPTPPASTFAGLNSIGNKTDSTATLYWTPHSDAVNYLIYDTTSGSPVLLQTISNPTANNVSLAGLTADATYKFIVRMENGSSEIDTNTTELSVTMNHAPETPVTPAFHTPATSPNTVNRPTLTVNGVKAGDVVKLYTDACSTEVASGTVGAGQTSINLQVSNSLAANTYFFYSNATNAQGHASSCTSSFLTYVLTFSFNGLTASTNKTDSTVTLNWSTHPNALQYLLYDVSSGTPTYLQTISNPATNSVTLTGLTPDATYKYRLKMTHNQGVSDDNTNDLTVVMNHAPATPSTPTYNTPASSPGTNNKPTFTVGGVKAGDVIRLYKDDATCNSTAVASGTVGSGQTSIDLQLSSVLTLDGTYTFYADATNASGFRSSCTAGIDYEFQKPTCPDNYVPVLGNATLGTSDFCVAKYEMKCENSSNGTQCSGVPSVTNVAKSRPDYTPWVSITAINSWTACNNLNGVESGTYALISNREWMTIARDLQAVPANWNGGVVGTNGIISRGHSNGSSALAAAADTAPCTGTGGSCTDLTYHVNKRTHKLSNDSVIWDLAGNVWEWVDWNPNGTSYSSATTGCSSSWNEFSSTCGLLSANQYLPSPLYTSTQNFGKWLGGSGGAALRGGVWFDGSNAGVFALYLSLGSGSSGGDVGFRCVYRP